MSTKRSTRNQATDHAEAFRVRGAGAAMFSGQAWKALRRSLNLSGRELAIVQRVFEDRTESAIANELKISPHTVHTHVDRLHHKLRVKNRVQLVLRVVAEFLTVTVTPETNLPPVCASWATGTCPMRSLH